MKLATSLNTYKASNNTIEISADMTRVTATSYGWWEYVSTDSVGNVFFNDTTYSISTSKHQRDAGAILDRLSIAPAFTLRRTTKNMGRSIRAVLLDEIDRACCEISLLEDAIAVKGSWRRTNEERRKSIQYLQYRIKDIQNILDNYLDKKPMPKKSNLLISDKLWGQYERFFLKQNGKVQRNELNDFLKNRRHCGAVPRSIDSLKELFDIKQNESVAHLLLYRFVGDTNDLIPSVDSVARKQLNQWLKRNNIDKQTLNAFALDKLHEYLTNKINRKNYEPREAEPLPVHPTLLALEGVEDLQLIKTDQDLRREGRQQGHCIGSSSYMDRVKLGYQALRYKGHTFFFSPDLRLIEAHGRHNSFTPIEYQNELLGLINAVQAKSIAA